MWSAILCMRWIRLKDLNCTFAEKIVRYSLTLGIVIAVIAMIIIVKSYSDAYREQKAFQSYLENSVHSDLSNYSEKGSRPLIWTSQRSLMMNSCIMWKMSIEFCLREEWKVVMCISSTKEQRSIFRKEFGMRLIDSHLQVDCADFCLFTALQPCLEILWAILSRRRGNRPYRYGPPSVLLSG